MAQDIDHPAGMERIHPSRAAEPAHPQDGASKTPAFPSRDGSSDAVRALACLLVMLHHAFQSFLPSSSKFINKTVQFFLAGNSGVAVFFVLSGFLLSMPFWKNWLDEKEMPSLKTFYIRRIARIAPPFWLNIVICYFVSIHLMNLSPQFGLARLIAGITFISGFSYLSLFPTEINGPLWSISFEITSYALLTLGAVLLFRTKRPRQLAQGLKFWGIFGAAVVVTHLGILLLLRPNPAESGSYFGVISAARVWWPVYNPVGFFLFFLLGIITAGISVSAKKTRLISQNAKGFIPDLIMTLVSLVAILLLWAMRDFNSPNFSIPPLPYLFPIFPLCTCLCLLFAPYSILWKRLFERKTFYY